MKIPTGTPRQPTRILQPPPRNGFAKFCSRFYALVCLRIIEADSSKQAACISKRCRILNGSILSMKLRENELLRMSWCVITFVKLWCQWLTYWNIVWIVTCVRSDIVHLAFRKFDIVYSSSVAFLAIPNLVDISQNFILSSMDFLWAQLWWALTPNWKKNYWRYRTILSKIPGTLIRLSFFILAITHLTPFFLVLAQKSWYCWHILWSSTIQPCYSLCFAFSYLCWCSQHMKYILAFSCKNCLRFPIFSFSYQPVGW